MLLFIRKSMRTSEFDKNFKTSHVIVYRVLHIGVSDYGGFQNISCYCLSQSLYLFHSFRDISKHLMLLFIVKHIRSQVEDQDFKTSHVIVYLCCSFCEHIISIISKHLMLLFIYLHLGISSENLNFKTSHVIVYPSKSFVLTFLASFQNISCYCLSDS